MISAKEQSLLGDIDFTIENIGEATVDSPLQKSIYVEDETKISWPITIEQIHKYIDNKLHIPGLEKAGPRKKIFHDPTWSRIAIVTCGGLCPGLNDVIKGIVNTCYKDYGVESIFGIRYGYKGLISKNRLQPIYLNPDSVDNIHEQAGSILGSSRGQQDTAEMVDTLIRLNINIIFCIGGDGTLRCANDIVDEIRKRKQLISVIGVPKTIDNDLCFVGRTFGFETAVYASDPVISCAHSEARAAYNGIGLVKLMGRDSGFIATHASLANSFVNFCLIPENDFELYGDNGLLAALERRLLAKKDGKPHAVIVVAEGAGQKFFEKNKEQKDSSGNILKNDIGVLLKNEIIKYFKEKKTEVSIKYFDPSYMIRSVPARGTDAIFCYMLASNAVHAAMAGKTNMVIGNWNSQFTNIPIPLATRERRKVSLENSLWQSVLSSTNQEHYFFDKD